MNEELTNEVLEAMTKCDDTPCAKCLAEGVCYLEGDIPMEQKLATALLEERAKPKVWDGAPDEADYVTVGAYKNSNPLAPIKVKCYTRDLPKTRARQIAENIVHGINGVTHGEAKDIEYVEGVLNKYAEELEEMKEALREEK
jgi:hypothetical protein